MAMLVPSEEMGGATSVGQLALTARAFVAPLPFDYLADPVDYRASWFLLSRFGCLATLFLGCVGRRFSPDDAAAVGG